MIEWPIVLGFLVDEAKEILESKDLKYSIVETSSPKGIDYEGTYRVIKQVNKGDVLELTVCQM